MKVFIAAAHLVQAQDLAKRLDLHRWHFVDGPERIVGIREAILVACETASEMPKWHEIMQRVRIMGLTVLTEHDYMRPRSTKGIVCREPLALAERRAKIGEKVKTCPVCTNNQVQILSWITVTCHFRCRACRSEFTVEVLP